MNQVDGLLVLISRLKDLKVKVSKSHQVDAIIDKLPNTWNDYKKKLLHTSEDLTLDQLIKHIRIKEETRICEKRFALEAVSKVNVTETKTSKKRKHVSIANENSSKKKNKTCFFCGKQGHFKKECRFYKCLKGDQDHK